MVSRSVSAFALVVLTVVCMALTVVCMAPSQARAQESVLPRGAAHLVVQVLEVARAVRSSSASSHRAAADVDPADAAADSDAAADPDSTEAADASDEAEVQADGGVIPYARTVVQLFGRGVPVTPLADLPRGGTTLNVHPCRGGCVFRLRVGF